MKNPEKTPAPLPRAREPDTRHIELDSREELEFWLKVFDTSKDQLLAAISEVGPYAGAVAIHLKGVEARGERGKG